MNLTLDSFRAIAGTGDSIGFVGSSVDRAGTIKLTKLGAHRTLTGSNAAEIDRANTGANSLIRSALFVELANSLSGADPDKANAFMALGREKLGLQAAAISNKPLERRVVRELIALRDEMMNPGSVNGGRMGSKDAALANFLKNPTLAGCTFSGKDSLDLLVALKSLRANGAVSCEVSLNGRTAYLMKLPGGDIRLRTVTGSCSLEGFNPMEADQQLFKVLEEKCFTGDLPAPITQDFARAVALVTSSPTLATDAHSPEAMRSRELCAEVILKYAEGTVTEHDLATLSAHTMNKIVEAIADGRIEAASEMKGVVESFQTPDLLNAEEAQAIAVQYQKANAEDKALISKFGEKPPASQSGSLFGLFSGIANAITHKKETDATKLQEDFRNFLADLVSEEDGVEVDKVRDQPGARLAYTLNKHIDTLVTLLTDTERAKEAVPEEQREMLDELVDAITDQLGDKLVAVKDKPSVLKTMLKVSLLSPEVRKQLADVEAKIDKLVFEKAEELQKTVSKEFVSVLTGEVVEEPEAPAQEENANAPEGDANAAQPKAADAAQADAVQSQPQADAPKPKADEPQPKADASQPKAPAQQPEANAPQEPEQPAQPKRPAGEYRNLETMIREEAPDMTEELAKVTEERPVKPEPEVKDIGGQKVVVPVQDNVMRKYEEDCATYDKQHPKDRLEASRKLLNKLGGDAATDFTRGYGKFMLNVMKQYFTKMPMQDIRAMMASGIRNATADATAGEKLGALLKGAGPIMHKMLQGLASATSVPDDFKKALEDMRSNLRPISDDIVKANLLDMVKRSNGQIASISIDQSLGAASVGQAFLCTFKMNPVNGVAQPDRKVVVKMLRPDVETRVERERALFESVAKTVPGMEVTFAGQLDSIIDELDLRKEAANTEAGKVYNPGVSDVKSMKVLDVVAPTKYTLAVEVAKGTTVDKLVKNIKDELKEITNRIKAMSCSREKSTFTLKDLDANVAQYKADAQKLNKMYRELLVQQKRLVTLVQKWASEGIFKSGFYHGDLHAGNIMVDDKFEYDEQGKMKLDENGGLTVIDFGNATQLQGDQRKYIVRMMAASAVKDTNSFLNAFRELMTPEGRVAFDQQRTEIHDLVHEIFNLGTGENSADRIFAVLQKLMQKGHELPGPIFKFSQCTIRLQGTLDEVTATLDKIKGTIEQAREVPDGNQQFHIPGMDSGIDLTYDVFSDLVALNKQSVVYKEMAGDLLAASRVDDKVKAAKTNLEEFTKLSAKDPADLTTEEKRTLANVTKDLLGSRLKKLLSSMTSPVETREAGKHDILQIVVDMLTRHAEELETMPADAEQAKADAAAIKAAVTEIARHIETMKSRDANLERAKKITELDRRSEELRNEYGTLQKEFNAIRMLPTKLGEYRALKVFLTSKHLDKLFPGGEEARRALLKENDPMAMQVIFADTKNLSDEDLIAFMTEIMDARGVSESDRTKVYQLGNPKLCRTMGIVNVVGVMGENFAKADGEGPHLSTMTDADAAELQQRYDTLSKTRLNELRELMKKNSAESEKFSQQKTEINDAYTTAHLDPLMKILDTVVPAFTRQNLRKAEKLSKDLSKAQNELWANVRSDKDSFSDAIGNVINQNLAKSALSMNPRLGIKVIFKSNEEQIPV